MQELKTKSKNLGIELPKKKPFIIKTPDDLPQLHGVWGFVGKRNSGKTVAIVNLLKKLQDVGCMDRLFIISPTVHSNKCALSLIKYDEDDVYEDPTTASLDAVIEKIEAEASEYEDYHEKLRQYNKYLKYMKTGQGYLDEDDLSGLWDGGTIGPPKHKYDGKRPNCFLFLDDCQNGSIFGPKSKISNMTIKHRHIGQFKKLEGAIGITLIFAVQSYKSNSFGLPRSVRGQFTLLIVFRTKDEAEIKQISEECSGEVAEDTFRKVYEHCTKEKHSMLYIDFHPKPGNPSMFRKNFDTWIIPSEIEAEKRMKKIRSISKGGAQDAGGRAID